jgi:stage II sporulation protein D
MTGESFQMQIGRSLGWNRVRSLLFDIDGDVFRGSGSGHGVGLCQRGAQSRAKAGKTWREILAAYYPGALLQGPDWRRFGTERLDVFTIRAMPSWPFDRAAAEAERLAGWSFRERPRVRVYPSLDDFRDATGEPGFIAASTRGNEVRIRMDNPSALTHELIHVLLNQRARRSVPLWLEEGLALYLSEPNAPARGNEADAALLESPKTETELRRGYEGARARVMRLVRQQGLPKTLSALDR